tara:strand:- start:55 stop:219 length:165 start_codon:yes stop_codon:yes gene_type:complete
MKIGDLIIHKGQYDEEDILGLVLKKEPGWVKCLFETKKVLWIRTRACEVISESR